MYIYLVIASYYFQITYLTRFLHYMIIVFRFSALDSTNIGVLRRSELWLAVLWPATTAATDDGTPPVGDITLPNPKSANFPIIPTSSLPGDVDVDL